MNPEQWLDEHGDFLFRYAQVRVRDRSKAEDLVQETFLAAIKNSERFREGGSERAWLIGILRHKIVDHLRAAAREIVMDDDALQDIEHRFSYKAFGIPAYSAPHWSTSPHKALEQKEFWDAFSRCLLKLDKRMHALFVMKELDGESTEVICKELAITPNHVWVLIHRARNQLKICLEATWIKPNKGG